MLNRKLGFQEYLFIGCWRIQLNWNTLCVAFIIIMTDFNEFTLDLTQYNRNKIKLLIFLLCIQICPSPLNVLNNVFFSYYFILGKKNKNFEPRKTSSSINTRTNKAWLPTLSCLLDVWVWYRAENVNYFFFPLTVPELIPNLVYSLSLSLVNTLFIQLLCRNGIMLYFLVFPI